MRQFGDGIALFGALLIGASCVFGIGYGIYTIDVGTVIRWVMLAGYSGGVLVIVGIVLQEVLEEWERRA